MAAKRRVSSLLQCAMLAIARRPKLFLQELSDLPDDIRVMIFEQANRWQTLCGDSAIALFPANSSCLDLQAEGCKSLVFVSWAVRHLQFVYKLHFPRGRGLELDVLDALVSVPSFNSSITELDLAGFGFDQGFNQFGGKHYGMMSNDEFILRRLLPAFSNLKSIDMSRCPGVTDQVVSLLLTKAPHLTTLKMDQTPLTENAFSCDCLFYESLTSLSLASCSSIDAAAVAAIVTLCPNIISLDLSHCCQIDSAAVQKLAWTNTGVLQVINLAQTFITDAGFAEFVKSCTQLTSIDISGCPLSDASIAFVSRCVDLHTFSLANVRQAEDFGLFMVAKSCKGLTCLDLSRCTNIPSDSFSSLFEQIVNLQMIRLAAVPNVEDKVIESLVTYCPQLYSVDISDNPQLSDHSVFQILLRLPQLKFLDVSRNLHVSLEPLALTSLRARIKSTSPLSLVASQLCELHLSGCFEVGVGIVDTICELGLPLKVLDVSGIMVSDLLLIALARTSLPLQELNLKHCKVSAAAILFLCDNCSSLNRVNIEQNELFSQSRKVLKESLPKLKAYMQQHPECVIQYDER